MYADPRRQSGVSSSQRMNVSDVTDPHALRNNYLEKSAITSKEMGESEQSSLIIEKNQREK